MGAQRLTCGALQGGTFRRIHQLGPAQPGMMYPNDPLRDYLARVWIDSDWLYINQARTNIRKGSTTSDLAAAFARQWERCGYGQEGPNHKCTFGRLSYYFVKP